MKFIQTLEEPAYKALKKAAKRRGILVQEMLRAVVIPVWLEIEQEKRQKFLKSLKSTVSKTPTATA